MSADSLRTSFLKFFESKGHRVVSSSPVVPEGDPTLLFTNAGMNQFKDVLLGLEKRDYNRATSSQKCIRAGGKHNDLDEVGKNSRHLTFFEMLGNWSFGDYWKKESIIWAWEMVTEVMKLDKEHLYVSVYRDDDESWAIWNEVVGLAPERIIRLGNLEEGDDENFWSMGPTGPCGPCTEIYVDHFPESAPPRWEEGFDEHRYMEIWNLVFMQYDRSEDGEFTPLPIQSVDTGMGMERALTLLEGVDHVFHTSVFAPILERTAQLLGLEDDSVALRTHDNFPAFCVIADHIRTLAFCVSEGATFSNEGRGYVLRRILRRAVRYGRELGFEGPFLHEVASAVVAGFGEVYPELRLKAAETKTLIRQEEERFFRTLDRGIALFEELVEETVVKGARSLPGAGVFKLYDTFGFPPDLTRIMAEERDLEVDEDEFERAMEAQRERSRAADHRYEEKGEWIILREGAADSFSGYDAHKVETDVLRYQVGDKGVDICLSTTPFYSEAGGQVGDTGYIEVHGPGGAHARFKVNDTQKTTAGITHHCELVDGLISADIMRGAVTAEIDSARRQEITCNHTATHLLHGGLHAIVSKTAFQRGSLVAPERLRFDFALDRPVTKDELEALELFVNRRIDANLPVEINDGVTLEAAEAMGAMMIFGEKYGDTVRVVNIPGLESYDGDSGQAASIELCGGDHVKSTGDIRWFRIVSESGVAAGVRRIEAVTSKRAFDLARDERALIASLSDELRVPSNQVQARVAGLQSELKATQKALQDSERQLAVERAGSMLQDAVEHNGVQVLAREVEGADRQTLLALADSLRERASDSKLAIALAADIDGKPALLVALSDGLISATKLKAPALLKEIAGHIGGRGGGRPHLAQAGGSDVAGIPAALEAFAAAVARGA